MPVTLLETTKENSLFPILFDLVSYFGFITGGIVLGFFVFVFVVYVVFYNVVVYVVVAISAAVIVVDGYINVVVVSVVWIVIGWS